MTTDGRKETGRSLAVLPKVVIYDPQLVQTLPRKLAVASALNAMAHCVESLWTTQRNPMTTMVALEGVRALTRGMLAEDPQVSAAELPAVPTWLARRSLSPVAVCITRSATPSAARSTCPMPRLTRWSCHTCSHSTPARSPTTCPRSDARWDRTTPSTGYEPCMKRSGLPAR